MSKKTIIFHLGTNKTGSSALETFLVQQTKWLKQHDLLKYVSEITCEKPRAKYYIDDKAIEFLSWDLTLTRLRKKQ